jgi:hypothetical protein
MPIVELTPEHLERFRKEGYPLEDELVHLVRTYPLPKIDNIQFMTAGDTYEQKRDRFCELLAALPPGLVQIMLRPRAPSDGIKLLDPEWQQRVWDAQVVADPKVQAAITGAGITLTNWREIMRRFEGGGSRRRGERVLDTQHQN